MELRKYFNILWRRILIIIVTTLVTIGVVGLGSHYITPVYKTSMVLRIAVSAGGSLTSADYMYADRLMNTYIEIATSRPVVEELVKRLDLVESPTLKAEIIPNTELIKITVEDVNPNRAAAVANTLADILITQENQLYTGGGKKLTEVLGEQLAEMKADVDESRQEYEILLIQTPAAPERIDAARQSYQLKQTSYASLLGQYEQARFREEIRASMITVSETAPVPQEPFKPRVALNLVLAAIAGLFGGLALAFVFENLDTTLYTTDDIESTTKLSALAKIPKIEGKQFGVLLDEFSPAAEAFRNLATNILQIASEKRTKVMLVMSAEPSQGKSVIVSHLAISLAEFGKHVIAVDCDTRIPRLHSLFQLENRSGLKDVLEQKANLEDVIQKSSCEGVSVLTSGSPLAHPSQMFGSQQMAKLIRCLRQGFDYVLLDSPALLAVADVSAIAPNVSAFLLVVRRQHANRETVLEATNFLTGLHDKFLGLIVNEVSATNSYGYYGYQRQNGWFADRFGRIMKRVDQAKSISNFQGKSHGK